MHDWKIESGCEIGGLIEAAAESAEGMQRHGNGAVGVAQQPGAGFAHHGSQPWSQ
jgi:hypothetical protein